MADLSWSTLVVEQQHDTMAVVHRFHPEYESTTLLTRTTLLQISRLLPTASDDEKQLDRLHKRLMKVLRKGPQFLGGRQVFVSELFAHLRDRAWSHSTREIPKGVRLRIFKSHMRQWRNQTPAGRQLFSQLAALRAAEKQSELEAEAAELRTQRDILMQRFEESAEERRPIIFAECRFTDAELTEIAKCLDDTMRFSMGICASFRRLLALCQCPTWSANRGWHFR